MLRALVLLLALAGAAAAREPDELAIGVTQYPSTLNPVIDAMVAKSYVLAMVRRPLTTYDADWHLVCMLCVTLPSFENGLAVATDLPGGKVLGVISSLPEIVAATKPSRNIVNS